MKKDCKRVLLNCSRITPREEHLSSGKTGKYSNMKRYMRKIFESRRDGDANRNIPRLWSYTYLGKESTMLKRMCTVGLWVLISSGLSFAQWHTPENLGAIVNSSADDRRPSISSDGNTLYFSSKRPGGQGDFDIWVTTKVGDTWAQPTNLGPPINTEFTDFLPCISPDGNTLYFISNRLGLWEIPNIDIWKSTKVGGTWQDPVNLGMTVNSAGDE